MPTLGDLLDAGLTCPAPPSCPAPLGYDIAIEVPPTSWDPGTRIDLHARQGVLNQVGGGRCGILTGQATAPDDQTSFPVELAGSPNCVAVPEPPVHYSMACALVACAIITRWKKPRSR